MISGIRIADGSGHLQRRPAVKGAGKTKRTEAIVASNTASGTARRVKVVGGSIATCTVAIELHHAGWDVSVFERSRGALVGRGAGLATRTPTLTLASITGRVSLRRSKESP